jgi:UDP-glucose:(heptosyl)LPS alpha-1,3-glucosyltransferase
LKTAAIAIRQMKRPNGSVRNVIEQSNYLKKLGYQVTIIAESASPDLMQEAGARFVKVFRWPFKGLFRRRFFIFQVERWHRRNDVDLFVSHGDTFSDGILVIHNCVRLYSEISGTTPSDVVTIHDEIIKRQNYRALIVNSEIMKRDLMERYSVPENLIEVFYQGVNLETFNQKDHDSLRARGREFIGADSDTAVLGLVTSGNLFKRNVAFFVRFAAILSKNSSRKMKFCVFGDAAAKEYRDMAEAEGIADLIEFYDPIKDVPVIFHALDLHIYPAKLEEFGRVVLEALACGVPSLVSDTVGAAELMQKDELPYVLDNSDPERWAQIAGELINDEAARGSLSRSSAEFAHRYSMDAQQRAMEAILDKVTQPESSTDAPN